MNVTIRTDGFEGYKKRALSRAKQIAANEKITPSRTLTFEDPMQMLEFLTAERIRLCEVARKRPFSISALAAELGRDPKSVRRDVMTLESVGLVRTREQINPGHGRVRIVEPVAKRFELRASF